MNITMKIQLVIILKIFIMIGYDNTNYQSDDDINKYVKYESKQDSTY